MSNTNGACPKLASTTSPGVCSPTVGYRFGYEKITQAFKEYGTGILWLNYLHILQ
jgi:hypothetical protein